MVLAIIFVGPFVALLCADRHGLAGLNPVSEPAMWRLSIVAGIIYAACRAIGWVAAAFVE
jgi:hypothetical protein